MKPITTAPKNATSIRVKMKDGTIYEDAHRASNLSGEEQPPFEGWFIPARDEKGKAIYFKPIDEPREWEPIINLSLIDRHMIP